MTEQEAGLRALYFTLSHSSFGDRQPAEVCAEWNPQCDFSRELAVLLVGDDYLQEWNPALPLMPWTWTSSGLCLSGSLLPVCSLCLVLVSSLRRIKSRS